MGIVPTKQRNPPMEPTATKGDDPREREIVLSPGPPGNKPEVEVDDDFMNKVAREADGRGEALYIEAVPERGDKPLRVGPRQ